MRNQRYWKVTIFIIANRVCNPNDVDCRFSHTTVFATLIRGEMPMVRETLNGTFRQTNLPNESEEYLSKRYELRRAEIELMNQRERVAELRRRLPKGPAVSDYVFEEV